MSNRIHVYIENTHAGLVDAARDELVNPDIEIEELLLKSGNVRAFTITIAGTVALNLVSSWLYDKLKVPDAVPATVNGVVITGGNVSVEYINVAICKNTPKPTEK